MQDLEEKVIILIENNKHLDKNCENIFDQLTDIRTSIQEIYAETSKKERFVCDQMMNLSARLEEIAKQMNTQHNINISSNVNPEINPNINLSNYNNTPSENKSPSESKSSSLFGDDSIKTGASAIVGFLALVGIITIFVIKCIYFLIDKFN